MCVIDNLSNETTLLLCRKKLWFLNEKEKLVLYLIFIGQKISYFRHYVHVRKSPDDMNKSYISHLAQASFLHKNQTLQNVFLISVTLRWHRATVACKIRVFKVDYYILPLFLVPKLWSVAQNEWKNTHTTVYYFWFKNKRVWAEKKKKFQKPKSCRQLP